MLPFQCSYRASAFWGFDLEIYELKGGAHHSRAHPLKSDPFNIHFFELNKVSPNCILIGVSPTVGLNALYKKVISTIL